MKRHDLAREALGALAITGSLNPTYHVGDMPPHGIGPLLGDRATDIGDAPERKHRDDGNDFFLSNHDQLKYSNCYVSRGTNHG